VEKVTGNDLKKWRKRMGLTQVQAGKILGVSHAWLCRAERVGEAAVRLNGRVPLVMAIAEHREALERVALVCKGEAMAGGNPNAFDGLLAALHKDNFN
jgi:predicted transcriptional regulator